MDDIANVNPDSNFNLPFSRSISVAFCEGSLNFDGALGRFQCTVEFHHESVANRFYLGAVEPRKDFPKQLAVFLQQFLSKLIVALAQRAVTHHVGEHDRGEFALFVSTHLLGSAQSFRKR
jgi:hypothetical protein